MVPPAPVASASASASVPARPTGSAAPQPPTADDEQIADGSQLETVADDLPMYGLIGFGVLLVAAVVVAVTLVRRAARARR
ncbi:hypothetical protein [Geodermatophilus sp. SYSU D00815]